MRCATTTAAAEPESFRIVRMRETLEAVRGFIEVHHAKRLSLDDLAARAGLSVFRFVTVFRLHFGVSPYRFLSQVRVERAKRLLIEGIPPAIVAIEVGLCDQSHLCRRFRSICGMTPGQFVAERPAAGYAAFLARRALESRATP
jgi:AraC-like DNA-binding protein